MSQTATPKNNKISELDPDATQITNLVLRSQCADFIGDDELDEYQTECWYEVYSEVLACINDGNREEIIKYHFS